MKNRLFSRAFSLIILTVTLVLSSCNKEIGTLEDSADAFVGTYNVSLVEDFVWGGTSGTVTDSGIAEIVKVGPDRIQFIGYIGAKGTVVGNTAYLEPQSSSSEYGYSTTVYNDATLIGNVLKITSISTGQLRADDGRLYPNKSFYTLTCIKQ